MIVPESISGISRDEFKREQERDETLKPVVEKIASVTIRLCKGGGSSKFVRKNGLIHREFSTPEGKRYWQVVVPQRYRSQVLRVAHESSMAGHLGKAKTTSRVVAEFYWPGVNGVVTRFCRSCDVCQETVCKGRVTRVPFGQVSLI